MRESLYKNKNGEVDRGWRVLSYWIDTIVREIEMTGMRGKKGKVVHYREACRESDY